MTQKEFEPAMLIVIISVVAIAVFFTLFIVIRNTMAPKRVQTLENLLKQNKIAQVIKGARHIIVKDHNNADAHYFLGLAYLEDGKPELALMEFKTVNNLGNFQGMVKEGPFRAKMAELFMTFNQPEEALKEYLLLLKMEPENAEYYYLTGKLFEMRNRSDKAMAYYKKAISLKERHEDARFRLGTIYYKGKNYGEAKINLEIAVKLNSDNYQAHFFLGKIQKESKDFTSALVSFERASKDPQYKIKALVERGACYLHTGDMDRAVSELGRAIKLAQDKAAQEVLYARYMLGMCFEKERNIENAVEQWEEIYKVKPGFRDVAEKLGQFQEYRSDDTLKDFLTVPQDEFVDMCRKATEVLGLSVQSVDGNPNDCTIVAGEGNSKWRNQKKLPHILLYLRSTDLIQEAVVREFHEVMRTQNIMRGKMLASSNFSKSARDFSENRSIELYDKDKLQELLKKTR